MLNQHGVALPIEIENLILINAQQKMGAKVNKTLKQRDLAQDSETRAWEEVDRLEDRWAAQMLRLMHWKEGAMSIMTPNQLFEMDECAIV